MNLNMWGSKKKTNNDTEKKPTKGQSQHLHPGGRHRAPRSPPPSLRSPSPSLRSQSYEGIEQYIKEKRCKNIIFMVGAGISTSAGIPDFRSPNGIYDQIMKQYKLHHPEDLFDIQIYKKNPKAFMEFFSTLKETSSGARPTLSHFFIKALDDKRMVARILTQNIDGLERKAGISQERLVEAHGTSRSFHCLSCAAKFSADWWRQRVEQKTRPVCTVCRQALVKPDIVFFGQDLPKSFYEAQKDMSSCDLLIVMGTSLVVEPFASLVSRVPPTCPRIYINKEMAHAKVKGLNFNHEQGRDIFLRGTCDDACRQLASILGLSKEVTNLMEANSHKKN